MPFCLSAIDLHHSTLLSYLMQTSPFPLNFLDMCCSSYLCHFTHYFFCRLSSAIVHPWLVPSTGAAANEKQPASNLETGTTSQEGRKRKRFAFEGDEDTSLQTHLIDVLERNGKALASHLDAQNTHFQLDREQRKNHSDSLVAVLNKLADALVRISEKL